MLKEFQGFIAKGNVMDMAVGIIIGAAFTAIVKSMVGDLINPLIGHYFWAGSTLVTYSWFCGARAISCLLQRRVRRGLRCLPMGRLSWP